jgi:hypothetical protein
LNNNQLPAVIDQTTGEVIEQEQEAVEASEQFLALLTELGVSAPGLLLQDYTLMSMVSIDQQADIMDLYNVEPLNFADITNRTLIVYGAAIYEHEAGTKIDGTTFPRYFQGRVLVDLDGETRLIKTSGTSLLRHIAFMCRAHGWFIFDEPIEYKFVWKGAGKPHIMDRVKKDVKHIVPKSHRKAEK